MAYAEKRPNGTYRLRASCGYTAEGRQVQRSKTWKPAPGLSDKKLEKELQKALQAFQDECDNCSVSGNVKFSVFADQWFEEYAKLELKAGSIFRLEKYKERTYSALGHIPMDKITPRHIQAFITNLSEPGTNKSTGSGLSPKTIRGYLSFVSSVFVYAIRMGMLRANPCQNIRTPRKQAIERRCMTVEEAQHFLTALEAAPLQWRAFFTLAIYSGLRRGELLGLEWKDIQFDNCVLTVARAYNYTPENGSYTDTLKTSGSARSMKLPSAVFDMLRAHRVAQAETRLAMGDQWRDSGRVFTGVNGQPMHPNAPYNWLQRFCKRHELPFYGIHQFRHLNATLQITAGTDVKTVAQNLGHSTPATTLNIYAHTFQETRARALENVVDILAPKATKARHA